MVSTSFAGFIAVSWTFTFIAIALSAGRYLIRTTVTRNFQLHDALHALALVLLIALVSVSTVAYVKIYVADAGPIEPGKQVTTISAAELRFGIIIDILALLCLSAVRFSVLALYKTIFGLSRTFMRLWWIAVVVSVLVFGPAIGGTILVAKLRDTESLFARYYGICIWIQCGLTMTSDLLVMLLPLYMITGLQMPTARRTAMVCMFCLGFVDIALDILRAHESRDGSRRNRRAVMWIVLESNIAVILSCLPAYRSLLKATKDRGARIDERPSGKLQEQKHLYGSAVRLVDMGPSASRGRGLSRRVSSQAHALHAHHTVKQTPWDTDRRGTSHGSNADRLSRSSPRN